MKYISQLNAFGDLQIYDASVRLSDKAYRLYCSLLHIINRQHWRENAQIANQTLMQMIQTDSRSTLDRARKELISKGYIIYQNGKKGEAGKYTIILLYDEEYGTNTATNSDTNISTDMCAVHETNGDINCEVNNDNCINSATNSGTNNDTDNKTNPATNSATNSGHIYKTKTKTKIKSNTPSNSPKPKQRKLDDVLAEVENDVLREALKEFVAMRKQIKKPLTVHALELSIKKLYGMSVDITERTKIVEQTVMNSWQSFYPLKDNDAKTYLGSFTKGEKSNGANRTGAVIDDYSSVGW